MSTQHTPGPWYVDADGHTVKSIDSGMTVASTRQNAFHPKDRVDADLIAAAPDMLAALEAVADWVGDGPASVAYHDASCSEVVRASARREFMPAVNAAIAKARGQA